MPLPISSERDILIFDGHVPTNTSDLDGAMTSSEADRQPHILRAPAMRAERCRTEETVISTMELPTGRQWVFLEDCNVLALSLRLDEAGRERAIAQARRECDIL